MIKNLGWRFTIIALVLGFLGMQAWKGLHGGLELGIDLEGGSEIIFKFDFEDVQASGRAALLNQSIQIVQERIDGYGLKEILIQPIGDDRFSVQIPAKNKQDVDSIKDLITVLGKLEFRITVEPSAPNYDTYWDRFRKAIAQNVDLDTARVIPPEDLVEGDASRYPLGLKWYRLSDRAVKRYSAMRVPKNDDGSPAPWVLCQLDSHDITGDSLENVAHRRNTGHGMESGWVVTFGIKKDSQRDMAQLTELGNDKKFMAIVLNDRVDSAPVLQSRLSDSAQISGSFSEEEARSLAAVLQAGALEQKPELQAERTVAADLAGSERNRGILSVAIGFVLVLVIMSWLYYGSGLLANIALLLNLILLIGVLTWFDAVLTLPGIAGVVLTVGMAVDANILVFERIKEEKGKGRTVGQSIAAGYDRALVTIIDSNLTTLITAYFLFQIGSGPVRGFGIVLAVGIVASMFTALYVTRTLFAWLMKQGSMRDARMRGAFEPPRIGWMRMARTAVTASTLGMVCGLAIYLVVPEKTKYDLDFTKGSKLIMRFHDARPVEEVRKQLAELASANPLYAEISARVSAEGIGAKVGDEGKGFELRSQKIATREQIDDFKVALREKFGAELLPGPFESTVHDEEGGRMGGTIYLTHENVAPVLVREAFATYAQDTGRLGDARVEKVDKPVPGAGSVFLLSFREIGVTPAELSLAVRQAMDRFASGFERDVLVSRLEARAEDKDITPDERLQAKTDAAELGTLPAQLPDQIFAEADPFPLADRIDPSTAQEHRNAAVKAIALSILGIIVYVAFRFRSWAFGFAAVIALIHDVTVVLGLTALVSWIGVFDARLNLVTVAAFLTLIGYSINDTIVVFDRIRENRGSSRSRLRDLLDRSINETLSRTIRTAFTTWIVVALMLVMNVGANSSLEGFAFILTVGVLVGTYSSIFIASPILIYLPWLWERAGGSMRGILRQATPWMIASSVGLMAIDYLEGQLGSDPSVGIVNDLFLAVPVGMLAYFLFYFAVFARRDGRAHEQAPATA